VQTFLNLKKFKLTTFPNANKYFRSHLHLYKQVNGSYTSCSKAVKLVNIGPFDSVTTLSAKIFELHSFFVIFAGDGWEDEASSTSQRTVEQ
jgi:hypothetical protein